MSRTRHIWRPLGVALALLAVTACQDEMNPTAPEGVSVAPVRAASLAVPAATDFESFSLGSVNYQGSGSTTTTSNGYTIPDPYGSLWTVVDEWGNPTPTPFDEEVVDDGGNMVWRLSNAAASNSFSNQPNTPSSTDPAGESGSALYNDRGPDHTSPVSPPNPRAYASTPYFHGGFRFKSATGAAQTDLSIAVSPIPRQTSFRMSYLGIADAGTGFDLTFYETSPGGNFDGTTVATGLSYTDWHTVEIYVEFVDGLDGDGSGNDIVTVVVDGTPVHTGTTWESYFAENPGSFQSPIAVDALMFRVSNAAPSTLGEGLYFDDVVADNQQLVTDDQGPVTTNVAMSPNPAAVDASVDLTADVDDTNTGGSNIASAEYSMDGGTTWMPMTAADGTFDAVMEGVGASLTAPSEPGIYEVCVRGTDEPGNTGDEECSSLVVYDPSGGFVTGGGWIDSPGGAFMPSDATAVTSANLEVDWFLTEQTGSAGTFVNGPAAPPLGTGSFSMSVQDGSGKVTLFNYDHIGTRLADIESISYATYRSSASTNPRSAVSCHQH